MFRAVAKWWAEQQYIWKLEVEAAANELNAKLSDRLAGEKRDLAARLTNEADEMDVRIKEFTRMEEKGYWLCENGHEFTKACSCASEHVEPIVHSQQCWLSDKDGQVLCRDCEKPAKFIKRDQMTGQEKYESDKERGEAEGIAKQKREQAKAEEDNAANSEKTAKYFRDLAQNNRNIADKIRKL